jgi:RNA polymerase sigma-70 factor (ECF subfamily)
LNLEGEVRLEGSASIASSLLVQLRSQDPQAWQQLVGLYGPVVYRWCRRGGLHAEDAADVGQEVFLAVARYIGSFRRERPADSFRGWLWTITQNKMRDYLRRRGAQPEAVGGTTAQQRLQEAPEAPADGSNVCELKDWITIPPHILNQMRSAFTEKTWEAFWRVTVEEHAPADVAAELGMSVGAVYVAKSRVLNHLRQWLGDLISD